MDILMFLIMESLMDYCLENHWDILLVNFLNLIKASNWDYMVVKCFALYFIM